MARLIGGFDCLCGAAKSGLAEHPHDFGVLLDLVVGDGAVAHACVYAERQRGGAVALDREALEHLTGAVHGEDAPLRHPGLVRAGLHRVLKAQLPGAKIQSARDGGANRGAHTVQLQVAPDGAGQRDEVGYGRAAADAVEDAGDEKSGVQRPLLTAKGHAAARAHPAGAGEEHGLQKLVMLGSGGGERPSVELYVIPHS